MTSTHSQRLARICDYIQQNLDEAMSTTMLCERAAFSPFHFHRVFQARLGVSVTQYIQLTRLKRASYRLAFEANKRVIDIAMEAKFESPEAFARAFKRITGQTPSSFRAQPNWPHWHSIFDLPLIPTIGGTEMTVRIVEFPTTDIAFARHQGPAEKVLETAGKFIAWRKTTGLSPVETSKTFGIPYSDPKTTPAEDFIWDVGGSISGDVPENPYHVRKGQIPGGRCAVLRHHGSHDTLEKTVYYLYRDWLSQVDESLRDAPCFFHYINLIHEVDECDLLTDVYLPLQ